VGGGGEEREEEREERVSEGKQRGLFFNRKSRRPNLSLSLGFRFFSPSSARAGDNEMQFSLPRSELLSRWSTRSVKGDRREEHTVPKREREKTRPKSKQPPHRRLAIATAINLSLSFAHLSRALPTTRAHFTLPSLTSLSLPYLLHQAAELGQRGPALLLVALSATAPTAVAAAVAAALTAPAAALAPAPSAETALEAAAVTHWDWFVLLLFCGGR
jgi:hypothetical protein